MNFQKLFDDYKIEWTNAVSRGWTNINCPYHEHHNDITFKGGFNDLGDYYHCWICGPHPLDETLSKLLNVPKSVIPEIIEKYRYTPKEKGKLIRRSTVKSLSLPNDSFLECERKYLEKRNFDVDELQKKYNLVGGGFVGKYKYRIIIPIYENGILVSWQARTILDKKVCDELKIPRYKNLPIESSVKNPKDCFFNIDNCNDDEVVIVEGPFDVMRLGDNFMCGGGTIFTNEQVKKLLHRFRKVKLLFDSEEQAQKKARKIAFMLASVGIEVEIIDAYSDYGKNDGGDLSESEAKDLRSKILKPHLIYSSCR